MPEHLRVLVIGDLDVDASRRRVHEGVLILRREHGQGRAVVDLDEPVRAATLSRAWLSTTPC